MISVARKIPILRYCLVILLFSLMFVGAEYLYLHYKKAQLLRGNIENVISSRENSALIDTCIYRLYNADNNSRLYTITGKKMYINKFTTDINTVLYTIDKIKFSDEDVPDPEKFKRLVKEKTAKTLKYIKLRSTSDSLIKVSEKVVKPLARMQDAKPVVTEQHITTVDTVKPADRPKKKLLGRLFAAITKKKDEPAKPVIVTKDTVIYSHDIAKSTIRSGKKVYNYYSKLTAANEKLLNGEQQILLLNNNLAQEIIASLKGYKAVEQAYINRSKRELQDNMSDVFYDFKQGSVINLVFLITLLVLVFYNLWKIFKNEQEIIDYSNHAEQYAQQKSKFLAGMSHEIRTPLNSVIGFSEQLGQERLEPKHKQQVSAIRKSSEMILDLVNEILDFSKYETGKMSFESSPFILHDVIEEVYTAMHIHALKKNISLENLSVIEDNICCEGDRIRLKQVMMNLIGNAIKFTKVGKVTLDVNLEHKLPGNLLMVKVQVADTGIGIDKHDLPHVFDEFSQVAEAQHVTKHKGTGLGLAICKKIIELQGGSIAVSSILGQGSVFSFELPLKQLDAMACVIEPSMNVDLMANLVRDKYVLLADDNRLNILLAQTILNKWGINFDVAYNGQEAMELFEKNHYDMVLTDIQMPIMDGLQLTRLIRKLPDVSRSNTIIMALTANVMKEDRDHYRSVGVNDCILKPFLEKDLIEKLALSLQNNSTALRFIA